MIHEFFAVTKYEETVSIYHVRDRVEHDLYGFSPSAEKIALKGESNFKVGERLNPKPMLAICKQLQFYYPEGGGVSGWHPSFQRQIEMVNVQFWGSHSSPIVALFTDRRKAHECFKADDLKTPDQRWMEETQEVLRKIGDEHPVFEICHFGDLALIE